MPERRPWTRDTIDDSSAWRQPLPRRVVDLIDAAGNSSDGSSIDVRLGEPQRAAGAAALAAALQELEHGRGFVILELPPGLESARAYWLVGQILGEPFAQNVQGTMLYDVRDTGQDVRYGARFSVTNADSSFHTDNSFGDDVLDYVGLLCLQGARSGGLSQLINSYAVIAMLRERDPTALEVLSQPFHVDRRGGVRPGESPTARVPIFDHRDGLVCRYLRYWIEAGHEKAGEPLSAEQRAALDALDAVLSMPELRIEFYLKPGDMFFINNRWLFHSRTAFEDHPQPERRRHYVRLWLQRDRRISP
jgi:alpha-ketoglutarate-dependent taurine dioxygenase